MTIANDCCDYASHIDGHNVLNAYLRKQPNSHDCKYIQNQQQKARDIGNTYDSKVIPGNWRQINDEYESDDKKILCMKT